MSGWHEQKIKFTPTQPGERYDSLDVFRGPWTPDNEYPELSMFSAIDNILKAYGDFTGINKLVWIVSHLFEGLKFMRHF